MNMNNRAVYIVTVIILCLTAFVGQCETKELVCDFTKEQSLPDGWTMGKEFRFESVDGVNCLYLNKTGVPAENKSIYTNVFYKIKKIDIFVQRFYSGKNSSFTFSFFSPTGGTPINEGFTYNNPDTSISKSEVVFESGEYAIPDAFTDYSMCITCTGVAISKITITYEERLENKPNVTSFIFKNYYGNDVEDISGDMLSVGEVEIQIPNQVRYSSNSFSAELSEGQILISANNIVKVEIGTYFLNKSVAVGGLELTPYDENEDGTWISTWEGQANELSIAPPEGKMSSITAIAVYTQKQIEPEHIEVEKNLSAIIKNGEDGQCYEVALPLQGVVAVDDVILYARTISDDACTDISINEAPGNEYDDDVSQFVQRDWIALDFSAFDDCSALDYEDRCISTGIVGTYNGNANTPTLILAEIPKIDDTVAVEHNYNTYAVRNFYGDWLTGAFVVEPQINEYAFVVGNIINTEGNDYAISDGHGVLRIDNTQGIIDDMCIGDSAIVEGIIQLAEYNDDVKDYVFYALGIDKIDYTNTINDIDNNIKLCGGRGVITIAGNVLKIEIFNISGRRIKIMSANGKEQLSVSVPPGCYFVKTSFVGGQDRTYTVLVR